MSKPHKTRSAQTPPPQFVGDAQPASAAKEAASAAPEHGAKIIEQVEAAVHEVAAAEIKKEPPGVAADRLVELATATLLKAEVQEARAEEKTRQPPPADKKARTATTIKGRGLELADSLLHKAEERLEKLPAPIKQAGNLAARAFELALWPARAGLRLAGELLRTPVAFAKLLRRSREA